MAASHSDHHGQAATWHTYLHFRQIEIERERRYEKVKESTKTAVTITSKMVVQKLHCT